MKRFVLTTGLGIFAAGALLAQDFDKAKKEFREAVIAMSETGVRYSAEAIAKSDNREAVDTLLDGYGICAGQLKQLWVEKLKWMREVERYKKFEVDWSKNPPTVMAGDVAEYQKWLAATKEAQAVEKKMMSVEAVKREIVAALALFKSDAAVKQLLVKLKSDSMWTRRAGIAEALGFIDHADAGPALVDRLKADSEASVKVACLDALKVSKHRGADVAAAVADQLKSDYWQVKYAAAICLRAMGKGALDAVEALIEALKGVDGRLKEDFNDTLVAITGVDKHGDHAAWKAWWDANQASVKAGGYKPQPGEGAGGGDERGTTFYGIPVKSKNVIFILDRSGSMSEPSEWEIPPDVATGGSGKDPAGDIKKEGNRKIDIARWQLKRALAQLQDGIEFNLVFFNHEWTIMSEKMVKLSSSTRKQAYDFIDKLDPVGGTNVYDPLEKGFTFAGVADKILKGSVDTIFLLTDGMPNAGQIPEANGIVAKIKELNKVKKVKVNTVGVFSGAEAEEGGKFLKALADDSGGTYISAGADSKNKKK